MAATTSEFSSEILAPGLRKIYQEDQASYIGEYSMIIGAGNILTSTKAYEKDFAMAGFNTAFKKDEGGPIVFVEPIEGSTRTYTWDVYALGFAVTEEAYDDDQYNKIKGLPKYLSMALNLKLESLVADYLYNGFTAGQSLGIDGLSLFNTSHTRLDRGTVQANRPSVNLALSPLSIEAALVAMNKMVTELGDPSAWDASTLIIPADLEPTAYECLSATKVPYVMDNTPNWINGRLTPKVYHFAQSATAWFVQCKKHDLKLFWRKKARFKNGDDFITGNALFKGWYRVGIGHSSYRGWYGSPGV